MGLILPGLRPPHPIPQVTLQKADLAKIQSDLADKEADLEAARSEMAVKDAELAAVRDQLGRHIDRERELELDLALSLQVWMCMHYKRRCQ